jgi:anti-sigma B factor antagonist
MNITVEKKNKITSISISGDFYLVNASQFESEWGNYIESKPDTITINCKNISFIDSTALGILVQFLNFLTKRNIELVLVDLSHAVKSVFTISKLDRFFKITTSEEMELIQ